MVYPEATLFSVILLATTCRKFNWMITPVKSEVSKCSVHWDHQGACLKGIMWATPGIARQGGAWVSF